MKDLKEKEIRQENKMGVRPVKGLLWAMGFPMMISMALQAVYNIVDSYFVSSMKDTDQIQKMGDYAVNALTLSFPIQMLMVAVVLGTGVGVNAILSRSLGEGKRNKASAIAGNAIFLGLLSYMIFFLFSIFGVDAFLKSQTDNPILLDLGKSYLSICTRFSFGIMMLITFEKLLQSTGHTIQTTVSQIIGALTNIVLDPILIFGLLGFPALGVEGAAIATVAGQTVSFAFNCIFHFKYNHEDFDVHFRYLKPNIQIIGEIYQVGFPAILMQALTSFMTYGVNVIFGSVSFLAVTAYGIYFKIQSFVFMAAFGMNNAIIPIIGYNYGRGDKKRIDEGIRYGMIYLLLIMGLGIALLQIMAKTIVGIFPVAEETQKLCILAIRIITLGYLFVGANIAYQGIFQALGRGFYSLLISLLRLIVIVLPLTYLFSKFDNPLVWIWWAFPIAEGVAFVVSVFMMRNIRHKKLLTFGK